MNSLGPFFWRERENPLFRRDGQASLWEKDQEQAPGRFLGKQKRRILRCGVSESLVEVSESGLFALLLLDILHDVTDLLEFLGILVGDLDSEFLFKSHDKLDGVEGVGSEILNERGVGGDLFCGHAELLDDDVADFFFDGFFRHG